MNNKAPDKIYLYPSDRAGEEYEDEYGNFPWGEDCVEYTRTDAFIEKACDAYCKVCGHYPHKTPTHICRQDCDYFEDFKKYMEGDKNEKL